MEPPATLEGGLVLSQPGDVLTWEASCGVPVTATIRGDTATLQSYTCPSQIASDGSTVMVTYTGGSMTLAGDTLAGTFTATETLSGHTNGTCNLNVTVALNRQ